MERRTTSIIESLASGGRDKKKQTVIDRLKAFFEKYFGIGAPADFVKAVPTDYVKAVPIPEDDEQSAADISDTAADVSLSGNESPVIYDFTSRNTTLRAATKAEGYEEKK